MPDSPDYKIKKLEKGPLQRFKNQNLLIKKFGEVGLQVYKAITGKRTSKELKRDFSIDDTLFDQILSFMHDAGIIELEPVSGKTAETEKAVGGIEIEEPEPPSAPARKLEDISPDEGMDIEPEMPPLEEELKPSKKAAATQQQKKSTGPVQQKKKPIDETTESEIRPIEIDDFEDSVEPKKPAKEEERIEDKEQEPEDEKVDGEENEPTEEKEPDKEKEPVDEEVGEANEPEEEKEEPAEEITISAFDEEEKKSSIHELSPVEKIISGKYGDIGLRVYALIDGQRTAEEIMRETGLSEPKLVEILDFMDEQGIIKLDYPKNTAASGPASSQKTRTAFSPGGPSQSQVKSPPSAQQQKDSGQGFKPIFDTNPDEAQSIPSPLEIPMKAPLDIIKSVQTKAKVILKYGEKGTKVIEGINGKDDVIDITLQLNIPLYDVVEILRFMLENGMLIMKAVSRADVRKKYGEDGYSVYKVYGKEGLLLYELIGKELTIRQMADKITRERIQIVDMFIFIHKVLGIELPIDKDVLAKQLSI